MHASLKASQFECSLWFQLENSNHKENEPPQVSIRLSSKSFITNPYVSYYKQREKASMHQIIASTKSFDMSLTSAEG